MKAPVIPGLLAMLLTCSPAPPEFTRAGCETCHLQSTASTGPSVIQIAEAYNEDAAEIAAFLRGERPPRVDPDRFAGMQPGLEMARRWDEAQRSRVADYLARNQK